MSKSPFSAQRPTQRFAYINQQTNLCDTAENDQNSVQNCKQLNGAAWHGQGYFLWCNFFILFVLNTLFSNLTCFPRRFRTCLIPQMCWPCQVQLPHLMEVHMCTWQNYQTSNKRASPCAAHARRYLQAMFHRETHRETHVSQAWCRCGPWGSTRPGAA